VLIRSAVDEAAAKQQADRPQLEERRRSLAEEIRRAGRALDRYYQAFENGDLDSGRFQARVSVLEARLAALREQDAELASTSPQKPTRRPTAPPSKPSPTSSSARSPRRIPSRRKPLLRLLIKDLRVNGRSEILPIYRIVTTEVCALPSSVGGTGLEPVTPGSSRRLDRSRATANVRRREGERES
jgi:hypothetical protein